jgi:hypothetical protein
LRPAAILKLRAFCHSAAEDRHLPVRTLCSFNNANQLAELILVFFREMNAQPDADNSDPCKEHYQGWIISAQNALDPKQDVTDDQIKQRHKTFTVGDDNPFPGGEANGVGNRSPEMPCTKCGTVLARNAPAKKQAT